MISFVITTYDYCQAYSYSDSDERIALRWSKEGLCVEQADSDCYLGEHQCVSGEILPWEELLAKKNVKLRYKDKEVICFFNSPKNETSWVQFVNRFPPLKERVDAINAYFGCAYMEKKLSKGLHPSFFTSVIGLLNKLSFNNSLAMNSTRQWKERFLSFLTEGVSEKENEELLETITAIKNNI